MSVLFFKLLVFFSVNLATISDGIVTSLWHVIAVSSPSIGNPPSPLNILQPVPGHHLNIRRCILECWHPGGENKKCLTVPPHTELRGRHVSHSNQTLALPY
ncbi:hypothetical protein FKM82_012906 [Ascaphus truei]